MDASPTKRLEMVFGSKKIPPLDLVELVDVAFVIKKDEGLGLDFKNMLVVNIMYSSPAVGQMKIADILLQLNGVPITAIDKMAKQIHGAFNGQPTTKLVFKVMRLKIHIPRPSSFPPLQKQAGYVQDTLVLYNLASYFRLCLDVREIENRVVVSELQEGMLGDITFSLGETIIDVDGERTNTCVHFNERMKKSLEIRNYCLITVEVPLTDPLKNLQRNKITSVLKTVDKIYKMPQDVKVYCSEGMAVLKNFGTGEHPKPILRPRSAAPPKPMDQGCHTKMEEKVRETDFPSGWNSRLFVKLPPMKTLESESLPQ